MWYCQLFYRFKQSFESILSIEASDDKTQINYNLTICFAVSEIAMVTGASETTVGKVNINLIFSLYL